MICHFKTPIFLSFLEKLKKDDIFFKENEDNGIFIFNGQECKIANEMLYRRSGIARTWRVSKESKAICKGKNIQEDFVPMLDEEFYNVYIKSILFTIFKL